MKLARARGKITLPGNRFDTSRKIPEEVFATGEVKIVADLLDGDLANVHMGTVALGIRHVLCVPLRLVRYLDRADLPSETRRRSACSISTAAKRASLLSANTRSALDTLATEAGVAIENARLYRQTLEQARIEHELKHRRGDPARAAAARHATTAPFYQAMGTSLPSRAIGGDFYDFTDLPDGSFGFAVGDVSGKGPAAALLTAKIQGLFSAQSDEATPAQTIRTRQPRPDPPRRRGEVRHRCSTRTLSPARRAHLLQRRPQPAAALRARAACAGSSPAACRSGSSSTRRTRTRASSSQPGDVLIVYSDGVTEALDVAGRGVRRGAAGDASSTSGTATRRAAILDAIVEAVQTFARGAAQHDDVTAMIVKFTG